MLNLCLFQFRVLHKDEGGSSEFLFFIFTSDVKIKELKNRNKLKIGHASIYI